jgi:hypothetical protein
VIGQQNATSNGSPQFTKDRFGNVSGAVRIESKETAWQIPPGSYVKGDTTLTLWVKKIKFNNYGPFGILTLHALVLSRFETHFFDYNIII